MIPNWLSFYSKKMKKKKVLTDEQRAILNKALADPVENDKFLYDSWRYKKENKDG